MNCPKCNSPIQKEHINIQTDLGQCHNCDNIFKISENLYVSDTRDFNINNPTKGTWIRSERNEMLIGASTRSPIAFFLVPFMLVWSGASMGGLYGTQIISGEFSLTMTLFGIPFLIASIIFWSITLMAIWGKVELTLDRQGGTVFTGLGNVGKRRKFTWEEISTVKENISAFYTNGRRTVAIVLEGSRKISFGTGLNESRRYYLFKALQSVLAKVKEKKDFI